MPGTVHPSCAEAQKGTSQAPATDRRGPSSSDQSQRQETADRHPGTILPVCLKLAHGGMCAAQQSLLEASDRKGITH